MTYHENDNAVETAPQNRHQRYYREHRTERLTQRKGLYNERKRRGICTNCGADPSRPGRVRCIGCTRDQADRKRERLGIEPHVCANCGERGHNRRTCEKPMKPKPPRVRRRAAPLPVPPPVAGEAPPTRQQVYYRAHRDVYVTRARTNYADLKSVGTCTQCGAEPAREGRVRCVGCSRDHTAKEKARRGTTVVYSCRVCGERGHNARTCENGSGRRAA